MDSLKLACSIVNLDHTYPRDLQILQAMAREMKEAGVGKATTLRKLRYYSQDLSLIEAQKIYEYDNIFCTP